MGTSGQGSGARPLQIVSWNIAGQPACIDRLLNASDVEAGRIPRQRARVQRALGMGPSDHCRVRVEISA